MKGKIIVIEGTDCSGKETQSRLLTEKLNERGIKTFHFSFPAYDSPTGKIIGGPYLGKKEISKCWFEDGPGGVDPKVSILFYAADRKYNLPIILEHLEKGEYVILDRYISSNMAHQGSKITDKEERFQIYEWIDRLEYWLLNLPKPDVTIFLHMPHEYSFELRKNRTSLDEAEKDDKHLIQSEKAYIELSQLYHWTQIECVKNGEIRSIEDINKEILDVITLD